MHKGTWTLLERLREGGSVTYSIPMIGGPLDGCEPVFNKVPRHGETFDYGLHVYTFDYDNWQLMHTACWKWCVYTTAAGHTVCIKYRWFSELVRLTGYTRMRMAEGTFTAQDAADLHGVVKQQLNGDIWKGAI